MLIGFKVRVIGVKVRVIGVEVRVISAEIRDFGIEARCLKDFVTEVRHSSIVNEIFKR